MFCSKARLRDERSSKRRKMTVQNLNAVLTPELLMAAAKCAREMRESEEQERKTGRKSYEESNQWRPDIDEEDSVIDAAVVRPDPDWE